MDIHRSWHVVLGTSAWIAAAAVCVSTPLIAQAIATTSEAPAVTAMAPARLRQHVEVLAAPDFGGRGTGQPGFQLAADYVREQFAALHLEPLGDDGTFFQMVPWTRADAVAEVCMVRATGSDQTVTLRPGADFAGRVWFDQRADGDVALLQCADPDALTLDAAAVAGRVLLVELTDIDLDARFAGLDGARAWAQLESRLRGANPAAVLFVDDRRAQRMAGLEGTEAPGKSSPAARAAARTPNELYVSRTARDRIAALATTREGRGSLQLLSVRAQVRIELRTSEAPACNVVGLLRGTDPDLADEHVLIGCHLDHLGVENGIIHPGADDDGSGIAGVLSLAETFAAATPRPRRSLVFAAFCGEERGLIGSKHFVQHPPIPLASIVAELQLDMIGRCEENSRETAEQNRNSLHLIGTEKLSGDLHRLCLEQNRAVGKFDLEWDEEEVFWRSDHVNFAKKGVPIAFFFTGFHPDYHAPGDTADKLDYDKLARVVAYVHAVAAQLAQQDERPHVDHARWQKSRERLLGPPQPAAPVRR